MPYAPDYSPTEDFSQDEANNVSGRSTVRTAALDDEFANLASCFNQMNANLKQMQRDDGQLKDFSVGIYALSNQLRALIATSGTNPRGPWQPSTAYAVLDLVEESGIAWICWQAFTSGASFDPTNFIDISGDGSAAISAADAAASALSASSSASSANSSALAAATSATAAAASAISAANSAAGATNSASSAATSASSASSSKDQAAASASAAQSAAADAQAAVLPGRLIDIQIFNASGTWTKPSGLTATSRVEVELIGAGGGGGIAGQSASSQASMALGGGGGARLTVSRLASALAATEPVVLGTYGDAGVRSSGPSYTEPTNGGDTYFGAVAYRVTAGGGKAGRNNVIATGTSVATGTASGYGEGGAYTISGSWDAPIREYGKPANPPIRISGTSGIASFGGNRVPSSGSEVFTAALAATGFEKATTPYTTGFGSGGAGSAHFNNTPAAPTGLNNFRAENGGDSQVIVKTYS